MNDSELNGSHFGTIRDTARRRRGQIFCESATDLYRTRRGGYWRNRARLVAGGRTTVASGDWIALAGRGGTLAALFLSLLTVEVCAVVDGAEIWTGAAPAYMERALLAMVGVIAAALWAGGYTVNPKLGTVICSVLLLGSVSCWIGARLAWGWPSASGDDGRAMIVFQPD